MKGYSYFSAPCLLNTANTQVKKNTIATSSHKVHAFLPHDRLVSFHFKSTLTSFCLSKNSSVKLREKLRKTQRSAPEPESGIYIWGSASCSLFRLREMKHGDKGAASSFSLTRALLRATGRAEDHEGTQSDPNCPTDLLQSPGHLGLIGGRPGLAAGQRLCPQRAGTTKVQAPG